MEQKLSISVLFQDKTYVYLYNNEYKNMMNLYATFKADLSDPNEEIKNRAIYHVYHIQDMVEDEQTANQFEQYYDKVIKKNPTIVLKLPFIEGKLQLQTLEKEQKELQKNKSKISKREQKIQSKQASIDYETKKMENIFQTKQQDRKRKAEWEYDLIKTQDIINNALLFNQGQNILNKEPEIKLWKTPYITYWETAKRIQSDFSDEKNFKLNLLGTIILPKSYLQINEPQQRIVTPTLEEMQNVQYNTITPSIRGNCVQMIQMIRDLEKKYTINRLDGYDRSIQVSYGLEISKILSLQPWIRKYLFQNNQDILDVISQTNELAQTDVSVRDAYYAYLRFALIGVPSNTTKNDTDLMDPFQKLNHRLFTEYSQKVNNNFNENTSTLLYFQYFYDLYIQSDQIQELSILLSKQMRQKYLFAQNEHDQKIKYQTQHSINVGFIDQDVRFEPKLDNDDLGKEFINKYIPMKKLINISDLLFLNGIKTTVYYRTIQLFHYLYGQLTDINCFTNFFDFYVKQSEPSNILRYGDNEYHQTVVNPNPIPLIGKLLTVIKDFMRFDVVGNSNWITDFQKECFSIQNHNQSTITCQSIGKLYNYQITDVSLEPIIMIAVLLQTVFKTRYSTYNSAIFKLSWSFLGGRSIYIDQFRSIQTILPPEWTNFYIHFYGQLLNYMVLPDITDIEETYQSTMLNHIAKVRDAQLVRNQGKALGLPNRGLDQKAFLYKNGFNPKSPYFEKAWYTVSYSKNSKNRDTISNFNFLLASYLTAGLILDTLVTVIQDSLNDEIQITRREQNVPLEDNDFSIDKSSAALSTFEITLVKETGNQNQNQRLSVHNSMKSMPQELWNKYCDPRYKAYDQTASTYNINCAVMLVWYSQTRQYLLGITDCMKIYSSCKLWMNNNLELVQNIDQISLNRNNSTLYNTILKRLLKQQNIYIIQLSEQQYFRNVNQESNALYSAGKTDKTREFFIIGIYYDHIFMSIEIKAELFRNKYNYQLNRSPDLYLQPKVKAQHYGTIMNIISFDIETTQIDEQIYKKIDKLSHNMEPYMISTIFSQLQCDYNNIDGLREWETFTLTIEDGDDFIEQAYKRWMNRIVLLDTDVYIISYNGCKFDIQFLYKMFVKYHSGSIEFYGSSLLSPKYIEIAFNAKSIIFIDLLLVLGGGSLDDWATLLNLNPKLQFFPIYSIQQYCNQEIPQKQKIQEYCEQDTRLLAQIYQKACHQMIKMMKKMNVRFNHDAINVLKPTLASTAYQLFTHGFLKHKIRYISDMEFNVEAWVRQAYKGGFCHCYNVGYFDGRGGAINYYDVNSLYPFIMLGLFPTTIPSHKIQICEDIDIITELVNNEDFSHWQISDYEYKPDYKLCFIPQKIGNMGFYFSKGYNLDNCFVSSKILRLIIPNLLKIRIKGVLRYGDNLENHSLQPLFQDFILGMFQLRLEAKQENDFLGEKRIKTLMNSLYGKMAQQQKLKQDLIARQYAPLFHNHGAIDFNVNEYLDAYVMKNATTKNTSLSYLALEIASGARALLFKSMIDNYDGVLYCDTDSMIIKGEVKNIEIDNNKIGAWKQCYPYPRRIQSLFIFSPKVYEIEYLDYKRNASGHYIQPKEHMKLHTETKLKGVKGGYNNFSKNFKDLQNNMSASFEEQVVWQRMLGFVRQNAISKKLQHRVRRYINLDGSSRAFIDYDEYCTYYKKVLISKYGEFHFLDTAEAELFQWDNEQKVEEDPNPNSNPNPEQKVEEEN